MSLFDGLPLDTYTPAPKATTKPAEITYIATIKRASNGDEILLCNVTPAPAKAIAEAQRRNLPLFTIAEIPIMRQAVELDKHSLDAIIKAKRTFPGIHLSKLLLEAAA